MSITTHAKLMRHTKSVLDWYVPHLSMFTELNNSPRVFSSYSNGVSFEHNFKSTCCSVKPALQTHSC